MTNAKPKWEGSPVWLTILDTFELFQLHQVDHYCVISPFLHGKIVLTEYDRREEVSKLVPFRDQFASFADSLDAIRYRREIVPDLLVMVSSQSHYLVSGNTDEDLTACLFMHDQMAPLQWKIK